MLPSGEIVDPFTYIEYVVDLPNASGKEIERVFGREEAGERGDGGQGGQGQSSPSDRRDKTSVHLVDTLPNGLKLYSFKYVSTPGDYVGVMAQDILRDPRYRRAVSIGSDGHYLVNYTNSGCG